MNMVEFNPDRGFELYQNEDYDYTEIGRTYYNAKGYAKSYTIHDDGSFFIIKSNSKVCKKIKNEHVKDVISSLIEVIKKDGHSLEMKH
ncbi:TPA: hypothetical protein HFQ00_004906 [Escherichia coli]|nr:hypothetical protein [Escherichia coli]